MHTTQMKTFFTTNMRICFHIIHIVCGLFAQFKSFWIICTVPGLSRLLDNFQIIWTVSRLSIQFLETFQNVSGISGQFLECTENFEILQRQFPDIIQKVSGLSGYPNSFDEMIWAVYR